MDISGKLQVTLVCCRTYALLGTIINILLLMSLIDPYIELSLLLISNPRMNAAQRYFDSPLSNVIWFPEKVQYSSANRIRIDQLRFFLAVFAFCCAYVPCTASYEKSPPPPCRNIKSSSGEVEGAFCKGLFILSFAFTPHFFSGSGRLGQC